MQNTWYLKYRPQTIAELDVKEVRDSLGAILKSKNLPHAFLFSGPKGSGKTSSARILAKVVNCEKGDSEPCNECGQCVDITEGKSVDVLEIDAASNRGIDDARSLKENIRLAPISSKYKVYIIDEVHMLTNEAANALLKTLEEPPGHVLFVLCTTEPHKLLDTVVSRCMHVRFRVPSLDEAVESLQRVAEAEKVETSVEALKLVARAANGGLRDGKKMLEQIYLTQGALDVDSVKRGLGLFGGVSPVEFVELLEKNDTQQILDYINKGVFEGIDVVWFVVGIMEELRLRLLSDLPNKAKWLRIISRLQVAYEQIPVSALPHLPLEVAVIELGGVPGEKTEKVITKDERKTVVEVVKDEPEAVVGESRDVSSKWEEILKKVKPLNHSIEGLLRSTKPGGFDGKNLKLEVFYKFHKDKLESDRCRQIVEEVAASVLGVNKLRLVLQLSVKKETEVVGSVSEDIVTAAENIFKVQAV